MDTQRTLISVGIVVFNDANKILFGRTKVRGNLQYILPVGHLEFMESFVGCAKRELMEECGIQVDDVEFQFVSNTNAYSPKHYIHIGLTAKLKYGNPQVLEEDGGIEAWEWLDKEKVPSSLLSKGAKLTLDEPIKF